MFRKCKFTLVMMGVLVLSHPVVADPLTSMIQVSVALQRCWSKMAFAQHGASVTLGFGFKRDGTLLGRPKPSTIVFDGNADQRRAFVNAAMKAVNECVPLDISQVIVGGVPGRVFSMEFRSNEACLQQCGYEESLVP